MLPKMRLKPTPYEANTSAWTASDVVYGESPNQMGGRTARTAAVTTIGRNAHPILPSRGRLLVSFVSVIGRTIREAG